MGNSNSRKVMIPASNDFDEQMSINKLITSKKPRPKETISPPHVVDCPSTRFFPSESPKSKGLSQCSTPYFFLVI